MPRLLPTLLAAALALGSTTAAHAVGQRVDVQVVDRSTGETLTPIEHDGAWWVAGRPGAKYRVSIVNRDGHRTLNVLSIDGINAMSGETAAWNQSGYVLTPYESTGVDGWRKNLDQVAAFAFASLPDSYAARTDRPANIGVIGVAVFDEARPPRPVADAATTPQVARRASTVPSPMQVPAPAPSTDTSRSTSSVAPGPSGQAPSSEPSPRAEAKADALAQRDRLGTAHGEIEQSSIRWVAFRRARPTPDEVVTIHYDRLENLIAMGIVPRSGPSLPPIAANPFPDNHRYVPDPPPRP